MINSLITRFCNLFHKIVRIKLQEAANIVVHNLTHMKHVGENKTVLPVQEAYSVQPNFTNQLTKLMSGCNLQLGCRLQVLGFRCICKHFQCHTRSCQHWKWASLVLLYAFSTPRICSHAISEPLKIPKNLVWTIHAIVSWCVKHPSQKDWLQINCHFSLQMMSS